MPSDNFTRISANSRHAVMWLFLLRGTFHLAPILHSPDLWSNVLSVVLPEETLIITKALSTSFRVVLVPGQLPGWSHSRLVTFLVDHVYILAIFNEESYVLLLNFQHRRHNGACTTILMLTFDVFHHSWLKAFSAYIEQLQYLNGYWVEFSSVFVLIGLLNTNILLIKYSVPVSVLNWCSNNVTVMVHGLSHWLRIKCPKYCWVTRCPPPHNSWQMVGSPPSSQMIQWLTRRQAEWVAYLSQHLKPSGTLVRGTCPRPCLLCLAIAYKASTKDGWVGSEVSLSHSNISPRMARSHKQTTHSWLCAPCSICVVTISRWVISHTTRANSRFLIFKSLLMSSKV